MKKARREGTKRTPTPLRAGFQRHFYGSAKMQNVLLDRKDTPWPARESGHCARKTRKQERCSPISREGLLRHAGVEVFRHNLKRALVHTSPPDNLRDLVHGEPFAKLSTNPGHIANADMPFRFDVEKAEDFLDLFTRLFFVAPLFAGHQLEELVKAQRRVAVFVELSDHRKDGLILRFVPERLHRSFHLFRVDLPRLIRIKQVERLLDL